jgi:uroporphyrinogen-III synthase
MRVLVTRPEEDARSLVAALEARGHEALVEPMLTIAPAEGAESPLDLTDIQALVFTSANGVRAFARLSEARNLPVFAVGDASAEAARAVGFETVESAGGDVADLARLLIARLDPEDGALYQAAASRLAGDLLGALGEAGFTLRRAVLYEARPVADLSGTLRWELASGGLDAATFFSPRTAGTFVGLVEKLGLGETCAEVTALAFSEAVAAKLRALAWREVLVAERPNQEALLARLDGLAAETTGAATDETMSESNAPDPSATATPQPDTEADTLMGPRRIIARFGGIRPMAGKLAVAVSTVQGWRERGAIPARHHERVRAAAREHGIKIEPEDLAGGEGPAAPPPVAVPPKPKTVKRSAPTPKSQPKPEPKPAAKSEPKPEPKTEQASEQPTEQPTERPTEQGPGPSSRVPARERPTIAPAAPMKTWLGGAVLGALVLALGVAGAVMARDIWMPLIDPEYGLADAGELMGIDRRVMALESAQASRSAQGEVTVTAETLAPLEQGLAGLGERLEALESRVAALAAAPPAGDESSAARLAELSARVEALGALEQRLDALDELAARTDGLTGRVEALSALEQRIDALSALEQRIDALSALEDRVEALAGTRAEARAAMTGEAAFTLAVQQLSQALRGSGPFAEELAFLRDLAASGKIQGGAAIEQLIAPLAPHADAGIPSLAGLKAAFPEVAREVVVQSRGGAQGDWVSGALRRMSDLVTLRPVGPVEGASAGAVVARAEDHLKADDLAAALAELEALQDPAAKAAQAWRAEATARLAARRALTGLGRMLLAQLGPAGG